MAHHDDGARVFREELLEQFQRLHVEIVGGFVHDEQVGRLCEQAGQEQPVLFSAGKRVHGNAKPSGSEEKVGEVARHVALLPVDGHHVAAVGHAVHDGGIGIECLAELVEIADLEIGSSLQGA